MTARYFFCWLWGALLASGWWASSRWFWGVPIGPNNVPLVGLLTALATILTVVCMIGWLIDAAKK